jgi:hypothetical protein
VAKCQKCGRRGRSKSLKTRYLAGLFFESAGPMKQKMRLKKAHTSAMLEFLLGAGVGPENPENS